MNLAAANTAPSKTQNRAMDIHGQHTCYQAPGKNMKEHYHRALRCSAPSSCSRCGVLGDAQLRLQRGVPLPVPLAHHDLDHSSGGALRLTGARFAERGSAERAFGGVEALTARLPGRKERVGLEVGFSANKRGA